MNLKVLRRVEAAQCLQGRGRLRGRRLAGDAGRGDGGSRASSARCHHKCGSGADLARFPDRLGHRVGLRDDAGRNETNRECFA